MLSFSPARGSEASVVTLELTSKPIVQFQLRACRQVDEPHAHASAVARPHELAFGFEGTVAAGQLKAQRHGTLHVRSMPGGERQATLADIAECNHNVAQ